MGNPWVLCGFGTAFCLAGVFYFLKKVFEEGQSVKWPVWLMVMGLVLIALGTARFFKLIN